MQHYGKLEAYPFRGPFFIKKKSAREQLPNDNNKNVSQQKYFNKNTYASNMAPPQATIALH